MKIYVKKGWRPNLDREIEKIFEEVYLEAEKRYASWFEGCTPELYINDSVRSLGRCWCEPTRSYKKNSWEYSRDFNTNRIRYNRVIILLSKHILSNKEQVRKTLVHEFGHVVAYGCHHDYLWKARADAIGEKWGITCSRLTNSPEMENARSEKPKTEYKYALKCTICGAEWKYKTNCQAVKHPEHYTHPKCSKTEHLISIEL